MVEMGARGGVSVRCGRARNREKSGVGGGGLAREASGMVFIARGEGERGTRVSSWRRPPLSLEELFRCVIERIKDGIKWRRDVGGSVLN